MASTLQLHNQYYYVFGLLVTLYILFFYLIKAACVTPFAFDKGQLIAHILFLKTPVLMVYPTYVELINYCSGFMMADFPWLNSIFGPALSEPTDLTPLPYLLFYTSLSFASTYLLAFLMLILIVTVLALVSCLTSSATRVVNNIMLFFFNFFYGSLVFASVLCVQGAFLNVAQQYTQKSTFYLLGFGLLIILML